MKEHNYFFRVRYGYTENIYESEWSFVVTDSINDEDRIVESFREFIKYIKEVNK